MKTKNLFTYNKKIDQWSNEITKNLTEIWGLGVGKNDNPKLATRKFLEEYLSGYLEDNSKKILKIFNRIFNSRYKLEDFKYYINSTAVFLHNTEGKFISIGAFHSFASYPTVLIHELSHIMFYEYVYSESFLKLNGLNSISDLVSENDLNELKEIITIIINEEFIGLIDVFDRGYPEHEVMRAKALEIWLQEKGLSSFIKRTIKEYKKGNLA